MTDDPLAPLRERLARMEGRPGYGATRAAVRAVLEAAETSGFVHRDAATGHFVTAVYAAENRSTTYRTKLPS